MRSVILVPGYLSSELYFDSDFTSLLWVNYGALVQGLIGATRLAPNGVDPGPPDGRQLYAGIPLLNYWQPVARMLSESDPLRDYKVALKGYDFRLDPFGAGADLADLVLSLATDAEPCSIVAHSFGGLVARIAWSRLVASGETSKVRRLITLGTPHWGTYYSIDLACGDNAQVNQLQTLSNLGSMVSSPAFPANPIIAWNPIQLRDVALTWPSLYSTWPVLLAPDSADDPHRVALYDVARWGGSVPLSRAHLDYQRTVFASFLFSAASKPPPEVLTTVAGNGFATPSRLTDPEKLPKSSAVGEDTDGDGVVTQRSALLADSWQYVVNCSHADLPRSLAASGELARWIVDEPDPPTPPPTPTRITGFFPVTLQMPPIPSSPVGLDSPRGCNDGGCNC